MVSERIFLVLLWIFSQLAINLESVCQTKEIFPIALRAGRLLLTL